MTPKDYEAMAAIFAAEKRNTDPIFLWMCLRDAMADLFEADNQRFDRGRFYAACEKKA